MPGHQCYHCKQWVEDNELHDCWTTTEAALTRELTEDLGDAWQRIRETAADYGEQRIYASHHCIMFARKACYFFVRPQRHHLEVCIFLGRAMNAPQVRRIERPSQRKFAHIVHVTHRDEVEAPITDWLHEAYAVSDELSSRAPKSLPTPKPAALKTRPAARKARKSGQRTTVKKTVPKTKKRAAKR